MRFQLAFVPGCFRYSTVRLKGLDHGVGHPSSQCRKSQHRTDFCPIFIVAEKSGRGDRIWYSWHLKNQIILSVIVMLVTVTGDEVVYRPGRSRGVRGRRPHAEGSYVADAVIDATFLHIFYRFFMTFPSTCSILYCMKKDTTDTTLKWALPGEAVALGRPDDPGAASADACPHG